jgi:cold shock CspA family protein
MQSSKKSGVIKSWHVEKRFGIIRVGNEPSIERYFFPFSQITSGTPTPAAGQAVSFLVSDRPVKPGQLPVAIAVDIHVEAVQQNQGGAL